MTRIRLLGTALAVVLLLLQASLAAQVTDAPAPQKELEKERDPQDQAKPLRRPRRSSAGPRMYMGRPIADVMSFHGADWLVRDTREQEEQPEAMLDALKIKPGSTVADVGAGVGYTSLKLARRVGSEGIVLATDVQPEMLQMLAANARAAGLKNVRPIRCTSTDTKLPEGKVDLVLMVDVYHECVDPETTLQGLLKALKPGGRLVLVEFRGEDPEVPIKPEHKMTFAQVRRELEPQGFKFKEKFDFLPWQHIIVFEKPVAKDKDKVEEAPARSKADNP
ncbi:class I SAM-dependent methyltransferase [Singulisphaera acidiphila]|uniref:Methylase involved in ubiquinone/menaquinone biosynthesis n=1 Tax=Singulisphaera acidiphila (strain ATCC BAA-1392 / DSM 18658 / VKM B-2454 / MOB10) TaxID=886293 RepID=L0D897_SINAD|nr:class I SAM-dependent methyltransferase [Singulisphaera acidiphila]AGA25053.1 methylase involved in ubiquinone/menaquinone biosynthesis [Singulisphaera acidiphila DSM 18658]